MKSLILSTHERIISDTDPDISLGANLRIHQELIKRGQSIFARYYDLVVKINNRQTEAYIFGTAINEFDLIIPRTSTYFDFSLYHGYLAEVISHIAYQKEKRVLNGDHFLEFSHDFNKLFQTTFLHHHNLPVPDSTFIANSQQFKQAPLPAIIKPIIGSKGKGIRKATQLSEIPDVKDQFLFQEVLPHHFDYRILVLNNKCLGAMKRTAQPNMVVSNFSAGGSVEAITVTAKMQKLAIAAAQLFKLEFCGVDLMPNKNNELMILEVNRFPSFIGFQKATQIDVAKQLVDYLEASL